MNEEKLDRLRHENETVTEKLNELQMQDSDKNGESGGGVAGLEIEGGRSANPEIHQLHIKI